MALNPRRRPRTASQEDNITSNQSDERGILHHISNQLVTVINRLDKIATLLEDKKHEESIKSEFEETRQTIQKGFSTMATNAASTNNILLQKDKEALKSHLKSWKNNLNERKQGYWSYLRTENLIKKYEEWCSNDPAIIPRKYTPKLIEEEPEEQKEIRMRYAKTSMKCDMEIMKLRITNFQSKYEAVDEAMISEIEAKTKDQITKATLIELWKKECQEQDEKSKEIWKEKEEWLLKIELEQTLNQNCTKEKQNNYRSNEGGNSPKYFNHEFPSNRSNCF